MILIDKINTEVSDAKLPTGKDGSEWEQVAAEAARTLYDYYLLNP